MQTHLSRVMTSEETGLEVTGMVSIFKHPWLLRSFSVTVFYHFGIEKEKVKQNNKP